MMTNSAHTYYENGDTIPQIWNYWFILYAYILAFVSAYSAVRLLDHRTWRTEKEERYASAIIIKYPNMVAAWILGFGTVWSMHFTGMSAVSLDRLPMCYNWPYTVLSLAIAIVYIWAGVHIASNDIFADAQRLKRLKEILIHKPSVSQTKDHRSASKVIHMTAFFYHLHWIVAGSLFAALGALGMHYTGMQALRGPFHVEWKPFYLAGSVIIAVVACFAGFWIVFRLLHWKVEQFWLRPVSAAIIAFAVCGLHFFGMLSAEYIADDRILGNCYERTVKTHNDSPNAWDDHQILVAGVSVLIPTIAMLVENAICRELLLAYGNLKNPSLNTNNLLCDDKDEEAAVGDDSSKANNEAINENPASDRDAQKQVSTITVIDQLIGKEKEALINVPGEAISVLPNAA